MTDKEIVRALEICSNAEDILVKGQTYKNEPLGNLFKEALDLINRQKAEIENMFSQRTYKALYEVAKADINKLQCQVNNLKKYDEERDIRLHARLTANARAEAITEFEERLFDLFPEDKNYTTISKFTIKKIAKKMKGGE